MVQARSQRKPSGEYYARVIHRERLTKRAMIGLSMIVTLLALLRLIWILAGR